jgi:hypothetical protein
MATHNTKVTFNTIKSDINKSDSAIREAVANAIDANSKNIYLKIYEEEDQGDLFKHKYYCLDIADDGEGIPINDDEFEKVFCQYKVSTKKEKTNYGRRGKGRYTYLLATKDPSGIIIYTKNKNSWYQIKFEANESDNIKIINSKIDTKPKTKIDKKFTTLVHFRNIDTQKLELEEENIENIVAETKSEIISFFADRIASKSIKIYINNELLKIDDYTEKKILKQEFKIPIDGLEIDFEVDFYIWNEQIKLKADRQKHILFLDDNNQLKAIMPSGKHKLSIANQKQNHTIIVKSKYLNDIDYMDDDRYDNVFSDEVLKRLRKEIAIKLEYILFEIYKKHLDKVANEYLAYLSIEQDSITTEVYHSVLYPFIQKYGNKKISNEIKGVIANFIDVLLKEAPETYLQNIQTILNLSSKESQQIKYIEENYGLVKAIAEKEKYLERLDILNNFDEMVHGKGRKKIQERIHLHHVVDKNLWILDEKFEDIKFSDIYSDISLKTILQKYEMYQFNSDDLKNMEKEMNLKKIPDIFIPIEKENTIYIIELKKPTVKISQKIVGEIMDKYTSTLQKINQKLPIDNRKKLYAIAISDEKRGTVYTIGDLAKDGVRIEPMTWKEVIDKTRQRYKDKIELINNTIKNSKWKNMEEFIKEFNE